MHGQPARKKSNIDINSNGNENRNGNGSIGSKQHISADDMQPVPPDGGWGWWVVFASFMIHIITDGMTYSFGLFYKEFVLYFNEGKGYTAWIVSIMVGVTFASGPISSSFVNRYGCRWVTIAGAILAAGCIIVSVFAQNVFTLILTIGFGTGLGFGLIYLPAIVSVSTYFEAKRSLATGIAVCGSGFGTFVFAPLIEYLIGEFGWRGAMLILGGIVLNCIIFGAMFRPLEPPKARRATKASIFDNNTTSAELKPLRASIKLGEQYLQLPQRSEIRGKMCRSNSLGGHTYQINQNNNSNVISAHMKIQIANAAMSNSNNDCDIIRSAVSQPHINELLQLEKAHKEQCTSGTMYRPDILYQGSLLNIPEYARSRSELTHSGHINNNRYGSLKHSTHLSESQDDDKKCCGCINCSKETRDTFSEMMNFSLLKDVIFIIFAISNFCTSVGFNVPYVYIVPLAETFDVGSEEGSYLIAIIGIANTVGRIFLGYISDKPWVNRLLVYNVCLTVCGISTIMCPLCTGLYSLALYCAVFGFFIGAYVGLTSVILVDLLGLDKLTNAFGLLLLFQGVASFIGPPIGGWMYDISESYSPAFIMAGIMIAISGVMMGVIPPLQRYYARKAERENAQQLTSS